jgi:flagellar M-ring protein FliF
MATAAMTTGNLPMTTGGANLPATTGGTAVATTGSGSGSTGLALANNGSGTALATTGDAGGSGGLMRLGSGGLTASAREVLQQPAVRRALPGIIVLFVLIVFGLFYAWMQATPHRPVLPGLSDADQQAAYEALKTGAYEPKIDPTTGQLTVPTDRYHEARMFLASQGLPRSGAVGLEALNGQSSMTTSQFMEQVKVNAAMEQELARSVMQIGTVQGARIHLATPKQSVFVRDRTPPKASVVVTPFPGRVVAPSQVQAIVHLVASSVPYMAPEHVTVVDNVGNLLTESASELKLGLTAAQSQHKAQLEEMYRSRIMQILAPVVGEANVRSQVNLVLDFTQIESTTENYDDREKGPKTRSEVLAEDRAAVRDAAGVPGALTNQPPGNPSASLNTQATPGEGQTESSNKLSSRATRNYELDRSVRYERKSTGDVQRVSVAVVVNERPAPPPAEGAAPAPDAPKTVAYTPEEIARMQELVKGVIGFDTGRGDVVSVVPARFEEPVITETIPWYLQNDVHLAFKSGLLALMFIIFMLVVVRPVLKAMGVGVKPVEEISDKAKAAVDGELSEEDMRMIQIGEGETLEEIKAKLKPKKSSISIDMLDTANTYDDKVALIRMLVAEDSGRVANVLKGMIRVA